MSEKVFKIETEGSLFLFKVFKTEQQGYSRKRKSKIEPDNIGERDKNFGIGS